jgi:hypothetical protein
MLEQLFNLIQGNAQEEIINNPAIPNEHNKQAVGLATESVFNGLQGALASGGLQQVMSLFGGKASAGMSNPIVSGIANNLISSLMGKVGLNNGAAAGIASSLIPSIISKLVGQTSDPNNKAFDLNGIIGSLIGGGQAAPTANAGAAAGGFDFNSILNQLTGGKAVQAPTAAQEEGGFDIGNLISQFTGGGQAQAAQQPQAQQGGSFQDILNMVTQGAQGQQQQQQQQGGGGIMDLLKGVIGG